MGESFSREKLRRATQKVDDKILCDFTPVSPRLVRPTNVMSRMNGKKTYTYTHTVQSVVILYYRRYFQHAHFIPIVGVGKRGEY